MLISISRGDMLFLRSFCECPLVVSVTHEITIKQLTPVLVCRNVLSNCCLKFVGHMHTTPHLISP